MLGFDLTACASFSSLAFFLGSCARTSSAVGRSANRGAAKRCAHRPAISTPSFLRLIGYQNLAVGRLFKCEIHDRLFGLRSVRSLKFGFFREISANAVSPPVSYNSLNL